MHPGNIQVSLDPRDLRPLHRAGLRHHRHADRKRQGIPGLQLHRLLPARLQARGRTARRSGWVPPDTRVDALEGAIRAVCEPHFDRPLKDISLGQVLMRLFQTSRRFNVEIQPQLVLLQKTLLNIEGPGPPARPRPRPVDHRQALPRTLDERPDRLARPDQRLKNEAPRYAQLLPELPRLVHQALSSTRTATATTAAAGPAGRAAAHQPAAAGAAVGGGGLRGRPAGRRG
jgi:ubiquinone biosynthesis protein